MSYPKADKLLLYVRGSGFYMKVKKGAQIVLGCVARELSLCLYLNVLGFQHFLTQG